MPTQMKASVARAYRFQDTRVARSPWGSFVSARHGPSGPYPTLRVVLCRTRDTRKTQTDGIPSEPSCEHYNASNGSAGSFDRTFECIWHAAAAACGKRRSVAAIDPARAAIRRGPGPLRP